MNDIFQNCIGQRKKNQNFDLHFDLIFLISGGPEASQKGVLHRQRDLFLGGSFCGCSKASECGRFTLHWGESIIQVV